MDFDKYTDRSRGLIRAAQSLALRSGHQQFSAEHLLKVLLEDEEGQASNLIGMAGGQSDAALQATDLALGKLPKVEGAGAGQLYLTADMAKIFETAEKLTDKADDKFVACSDSFSGVGWAANRKPSTAWPSSEMWSV